MKYLTIIFISIFSFACKKKIEEKPVLPICTCKDANVFNKYINQEGELCYPDTAIGSVYSLRNVKGLISLYGPDFNVCFDTLFLNQIKIKQIKDKSIVKFSCEQLGNSKINSCEGKPVFERQIYDVNITSIDPK
jgi:hypothetical protein